MGLCYIMVFRTNLNVRPTSAINNAIVRIGYIDRLPGILFYEALT
jgi:hypothetical protein